MNKPYPTIPQIEAEIGMPEQAWDRVLPDALIKAICDVDRGRVESPVKLPNGWVSSCKSPESC